MKNQFRLLVLFSFFSFLSCISSANAQTGSRQGIFSKNQTPAQRYAKKHNSTFEDYLANSRKEMINNEKAKNKEFKAGKKEAKDREKFIARIEGLKAKRD